MHPSHPFAFVLFAAAVPLIAQGGWVQRFPAHSPPPRVWHGLAFDAQRGVHVLFGGGVVGSVVHGDTWEWNGLDWQQRTPANSPPARQGHAMAYDFPRGRVAVFGGRDSGLSLLADTWEFDGVDWAQRLPAQSPAAREFAGMAFSSARGRLILFGGVGLQGTWEWDGTGWTQLATAHAPSPRYAFGMTSDFVRGRVLVSGGYNSAFLVSDAWGFDGVDWIQLPATQSPPPCLDTGLAADPTRGMIVQFGGSTYSGTWSPTNQTWLHDGSDWRRDLRPTTITPRRAMALGYDWLRDRVVLFGGFAGTGASGIYLGETWEYDLAGVALWLVAGAGCAGTQGVPQLRPISPQRAILGTSFQLLVSGGVTGGALFGLGFSNTSWNGTPLPLSLAGFGMPGCELHTSLEVVSFAPGVLSTAQLTLAIPNDPGLVGVRLYAQAFVPQPGVNPLGAVMSNAVVNEVGAF